MKPKHPFLALFLVAIFLSISVHASGAAVVRGEPVTPAEAASLVPVCKLILIEKPNAHIDHIAQKQNAALFDRPEYRMAKNAIHLHHWCRAAVLRDRYFNADSPLKKRGYKADFHDEMDYVIRNMGPDWPYMPLMHVENGEMYLLEKKYGEAATEALSAIYQTPTFARGHVLLVNAYSAMGQKNKALEAATEGVKYNPTSGSLKRLYDEMGGAKPYPEPYAKPAEATPTPSTQQPAQSTDTGEKPSNEGATPPQPSQQSGEAAPVPAPVGPAATEPAPNKYCRFCP